MANQTTLNKLQETIAIAAQAYNSGDMDRAYELIRPALELEPENASAHYLAGLAAIASYRVESALQHFQVAARSDPKNADFAVQLARALSAARRIGESVDAANHALSLQPSDPIMLDNLGCVYQLANLHEPALDMFRKAVAAAPGNALCRFNYAMSLLFTSDIPGAEREIDALLDAAPEFWRGYTVRSKLRRQTADRNHVDRLEHLLSRNASNPYAAYFLHMALGCEYEDLENYANAFQHFALGNAGIRRNLAYDPDRDAALVDALIEAFPAAGPADGCMSEEPIFIVGMPRTGTTLVERILSSHPQVFSAGELETFPGIVEQLCRKPAYSALDEDMIRASVELDPHELGSQYIDGTRPMTALKPRFIDKRPHNFLYLGLIARALPKARIICLRRDPVDTCLSNFREAFNPDSTSHHYSFDLLETGRYYVQFDRIMAHWKRILPGRIHEVEYERIVSDQEGTTRELLDYCDLPWHDRCLHFELNATATSTASSVQVRSPMYRTAVKRWMKYEQPTRPLRQLLEAAGIQVTQAQVE